MSCHKGIRIPVSPTDVTPKLLTMRDAAIIINIHLGRCARLKNISMSIRVSEDKPEKLRRVLKLPLIRATVSLFVRQALSKVTEVIKDTRQELLLSVPGCSKILPCR